MVRNLFGVLLFFVPALQAAANPAEIQALARGQAALREDNLDKAIAEFTEAIKLDPQDFLAYKYRGAAYFYSKQYDNAIKDLSERIRLDPTQPNGYGNRGCAYLENKQYDNAIKDFAEAIRLSPNSDNYNLLGNAHMRNKEYEKAINDFNEAIRRDPLNAPSLANVAWIMATCPKDSMRNGKKALEIAIKACEAARWKTPKGLATLAAAYAECGDFKEAVKWQKKSIEIRDERAKDFEKDLKQLKVYEAGKPYRDE